MAPSTVQAPETLITAFLRRASSSAFGSAAHGSGGVGSDARLQDAEMIEDEAEPR